MDTRDVVDRHAVVGGEPSADIEVSSPVEHRDDGEDPGIKRRFGSQTRFVKRRHQGAISIQPQQPKYVWRKKSTEQHIAGSILSRTDYIGKELHCLCIRGIKRTVF